MVRDHEAVNKQALDLVKKLKVTPEDNDTSKSLSKQASDKLMELSKLKGADYDKAYIANEVAYHKAGNDALETQLIPSARTAGDSVPNTLTMPTTKRPSTSSPPT
jgi:putative membrane protein